LRRLLIFRPDTEFADPPPALPFFFRLALFVKLAVDVDDVVEVVVVMFVEREEEKKRQREEGEKTK
jgi:hypothetical protein